MTGCLSVTDSEAFKMAFVLARTEGLFLGPSAALNVVGALKLAIRQKRERGGEGGDVVVATVLCDGGGAYLSKLYNEEWRKENGCEGVEKAELADVLEDEEGGWVERGADELFEGHVGGS